MKTFADFIAWERASRDSIDFKKVYVDIAGDLNAGLMLSEIIYWYLPSKNSDVNKLRIERDGYSWLAIRRTEWWDRTRLSPDQADRALGLLVKAGIVKKTRYKFAGELAVHIRVDEKVFMSMMADAIEHPATNPYVPTEMELGKKAKSNLVKVENGIAENAQILLTESTASNTSKDSTPKSPKGTEVDNSPEAESISAIINTYLSATQTIDPSAYRNKSKRSDALFMHKQGVTPELVRAWALDLRSQAFWKTRAINWKKFTAEILPFKDNYVAPVVVMPVTPFEPAQERAAPDEVITEAEKEELRQMFEALVNAKDANDER